MQSTVAASTLELTLADLADIESVLTRSKGPKGPVFGLERVMERCHGSIMKYNLNCVNKGVHLEELCHRFVSYTMIHCGSSTSSMNPLCK